ILGILAAVAVPAYSGYITKANEAGDTQVLSAANTAFSAAATENQVAFDDLGDYLKLTVTAGTKGCSIVVDEKSTTATETETAILNDFKAYYGSDTIVFDYYTSASFGTDGNLAVVEPTN
ncbi:MAG: hypothetical protein IJ486_06570, partial [Firmicutes bacterium]|nr:hypothetical protein [Bacillota bacterium]